MRIVCVLVFGDNTCVEGIFNLAKLARMAYCLKPVWSLALGNGKNAFSAIKF